MLTLWHAAYSREELVRLGDLLWKAYSDIPCSSTGCRDCENYHICDDLNRLMKYCYSITDTKQYPSK